MTTFFISRQPGEAAISTFRSNQVSWSVCTNRWPLRLQVQRKPVRADQITARS